MRISQDRASRWPVVISVLIVCAFATACVNLHPQHDLRNIYVEVWGAVERPRVYQVPERTAPQAVLALAGGISSAARAHAYVIRHAWFVSEFVSEADELQETQSEFSRARQWRSGDMLIVCGRGARGMLPHSTNNLVQVVVSGGVQKEGRHWVSANASLIDLLRTAGGVSTRHHNDARRLAHAIIVRREPSGESTKRRIPANGASLKIPLALREGDLVILGYHRIF